MVCFTSSRHSAKCRLMVQALEGGRDSGSCFVSVGGGSYPKTQYLQMYFVESPYFLKINCKTSWPGACRCRNKNRMGGDL